MDDSMNGPGGVSAGAVGEARRWLLGEFAGSRAQALDVLVATAVESRAVGDEADGGLLRAGMGEVFDVFCACAADGRAMTGDEIAFFERLGAVRCEQGAEFEVVAAEFRTAFDQCYGRLAGLAGDRPAATCATALGELTPALYRLRDTALTAIDRGHARQARQLAETGSGPQAGLLRAVLAGQRRRLAAERDRHGLAAGQPAVLVLAVPASATSAGRLQGLLEPLAAAVPAATAAVVAPSPSPHVAVLVPASIPEAELLAAARTTPAGRLGLYALPAAPLAALAEVYRRLAPHLELADTLADETGIVCPHQLAIYRLLAAIPAAPAQQFAVTTLGGLLARPTAERTRLLASLQALCATGSVAEAARQLGYERRSIHRHLSRIARLTGLDARQAGPRQRLELALGLWQLHRHRLSPPGEPGWATPLS